jgi:iron complex transport system ATP-binding protein
VLEISDLSLSIGDRDILRNVSLTVARGEFVAVVGPNGSGKSSLLKCVNRVHARCRGEIFLDSRPARRMSQRALARLVAYVPQFADGLAFSGFTVRQFVEQGRYPWGDAGSEKGGSAVAEALSLAGVEEFSGRSVGSLSGGERQRALIAAALAQDASLLLLDEPTAFLDFRRQAEVLRLIRSIHGKRSILMVTHDLNLALRSADRLAVLTEGAIAWSGKAEELTGGNLLERLFGVGFLRFGAGSSSVPFIAPAALAAPEPAEPEPEPAEPEPEPAEPVLDAR